MNAPGLHAQDHRRRRAAPPGWRPATRPPRQIVEELYLLRLQPVPDRRGDERSAESLLRRGRGRDRRAAIEDLLWALINSAEFVFKD